MATVTAGHDLRKRKEKLPEPPTNSLQEKKAPKSGAQRQREYRERLKQKGEYATFKIARKLDSQHYRKNRKETETDQEKEMRREKTKERVRKCRERKKQEEQDGLISPVQKILTRKQREKILIDTRERKRKQRENWSAAKWAEHRQKCRERYHQNKMQKEVTKAKTSERKTQLSKSVQQEQHWSVEAFRKAFHRFIQKLPKDVYKKEAMIAEFYRRFAPSTFKSLTGSFEFEGDSAIEEHLKFDRLSKRKLAFAILKQKKRYLAKSLGINHTYIMVRLKKMADPLKLRQRSKTTLTRNKEVQEFYFSMYASNPLSERKKTKKGKPTYVLQKNVNQLYEEYKKTTTSPVCKSLFAKLRPANVKLPSSERLNQCLCDICENVCLKLEKVNKYLPKEKKITSKYEIANIMLCPKTEDSTYHQLHCLEEKCDKLCGQQKLSNYLLEFTNLKADVDHIVSWNRWATTDKKKTVQTKTGSVKDLIEEFVNDAKLYPLHLFKASWQSKEFSSMKSCPPLETLVSVLDFAENYRCVLQDEIQSAHWSYKQATLHPFVNYYSCPQCTSVVTHVVAVVSDDTCHDNEAVKQFTLEVLNHLNSKNIFFKRFIQWSDGCCAQYKSKKTLLDLSILLKSKKISVERNFFGARHGKNACDGESAVIKSSAVRAVRARRCIIQTAEDLYEYCNANLSRQGENGQCCHYQRDFLFVTNITRAEPEKELRTFKGTRNLHSIRTSNGRLESRTISCYCHGCENGWPCFNSALVSDWCQVTLKYKDGKNAVIPECPDETDGACNTLGIDECPTENSNTLPALLTNWNSELLMNSSFELNTNFELNSSLELVG